MWFTPVDRSLRRHPDSNLFPCLCVVSSGLNVFAFVVFWPKSALSSPCLFMVAKPGLGLVNPQILLGRVRRAERTTWNQQTANACLLW